MVDNDRPTQTANNTIRYAGIALAVVCGVLAMIGTTSLTLFILYGIGLIVGVVLIKAGSS